MGPAGPAPAACGSLSAQMVGVHCTGASLASVRAGPPSQSPAHWPHTVTRACLGSMLSLDLGTYCQALTNHPEGG